MTIQVTYEKFYLMRVAADNTLSKVISTGMWEFLPGRQWQDSKGIFMYTYRESRIYVCICVHVYAYTCIFARKIYSDMYVNQNVYVCIYTCTYIPTRFLRISTRARFIEFRTVVYLYTIYIYIHTYIYIHKYRYI